MLSDQDKAAKAQRERVLAMSPADRLRMLDRLCRELTRIATTAKRLP